jgi:uncharacterized protein YbaP (TraB family)
MITAMIAASIAATPPAAAAPAPLMPDAQPALWVVNDHDTIIYLFGTFHALDGRSAWFNDEVKTAFAASNELVLETLIPPPPGMPAAPAEEGEESRLKPIGPMPPVAGSASFLSTSKAVMKAGRAHGMSTDHGADTVLRQAAEASGKPVSGLESFDYQIAMFSRLRGATAPADQQQAAAMSAALAEILSRLQAAWNRGDAESFAPMLEEMSLRSPETYRLMFAERNSRWAGWIGQRLQQPGTVFVAVGAGHLAGRDSVQRKLAQSNIRVARVN